MKPANPAASDEWQSLRKDKRSALIVLAIIAASTAAILALIGILLLPTRATDRTSPLYWALMLPFAWWAASLANYTPWAVRTARPAAAISVAVTLSSLGLAATRTADLTPWIIAACIAAVGATLGLVLFPGSRVAQRGR